ncbi:hypothetical protein [Salinarimonas soli]|uniref:Uncharacterized protein n=1 Tax=Salinarimonas soli TaxID=1638099 RepID=A0A5B2VH05_9HYPH|nr:hypothetical protein [Salinarimonas soli]KAA2238174.1 hypothetical protein F0L46_05865 [Salinarimonas soli]
MTDESPPPSYSHNPRPVGYPLAFKLLRNRLVVDTTRKVEEMQLGAVTRIRLSYEPRSFAQRAFRTRVTLVNGRTVTFTSVSWTSIMNVRSQEAEYSAFVHALIEAVARANPKVELITGKHAVLWSLMISAAAFTLVAVALFAWRAFESGAPGAALLGAAVAAVGIWQLEPIIRLNRPGRFAPDALPEALLPKA